MNFASLSNADYTAKLYKVIAAVESERPLIYIDGSGLPTIGTGFLMTSANAAQVRDAVFKQLGFHDSVSMQGQTESVAVKAIEDAYRAELQTVFNKKGGWKAGTDSTGWNPTFLAEVDEIMHRRFIDAGLTFAKRETFSFSSTVDAQGDNAEIKAAFEDGIRALYEGRTTTAFGSLPDSSEKIALFTASYLGVQNDIKRALGNKTVAGSSRAEVWFAMRSGALQMTKGRVSAANFSSNEFGWAKRNYFAAQLFGLYEIPGQASADEARQTFAALTRNRDLALQFEQRYGEPVDGSTATRNMIPAANGDAAYSAALTAAGKGAVESLYLALAPARGTFITWVNTQLPAGETPLAAANWNPAAIYFRGPDMAGNVLDANADNGKGRDLDKNLLVGDDRSDYLRGGTGNDVLIAAGSDDVLEGGAGADTLYGGAGDDTYVWNVGDGNDRIVDPDGGRLIINGDTYQFGGGPMTKDGSSNVWRDATGNVVITHNSPWRIELSDGSVIQLGEDFDPTEWGITLAEQPGAPTQTITGDKDYGPNPNQPLVDAWGNPAGNATPNSEDTLSGSTGNDRIDGLGGRDQIHGQGGDDLIEGGAAADIVAAGVGNDQLFGSVEIDLPQAIANGDAQNATGLKGDWLNGGDGDDIIVSGADNDALFGGHGSDILVGGAGDDVLDGDDDFTAISFDWTITDYGNPFDRLFSLIQIESAPAGAADVLYGGAGNDALFGLFGDDQLYGDAGNDTLSGDDGDDELFAGDGDDYLTGDYGKLAYDSGFGTVIQGNDYLDGGAGNDWMQGESGNDDLYGGAGNDLIWGDANTYAGAIDGDDYLDGEEGNDQLVAGGGSDDLFGGAGSDTLFGDAGDDYLDGEDDNDALVGGDGNDQLFGGAGNDSLWGDSDALGTGADYLDGEDGDDILMGYSGADTLAGGLGKDTLLGGDGGDQLSGDDGDDLLTGEAGDDFLEGGDGNDAIRGDDGDDALYGDGGADVLYGLAGADVLDGGDGNDELQGGDANDTLYGGTGDDLVVGQLGDDVLDGEDGNDEVQGNEGNDTVDGGSGNDIVFGLAGNDIVSGDDGDDYVDGGDGNDSLYGDAGSDWMLGGNGNDTLEGGEGDDLLSGDSGVDTYVFGRGSGHDVIENYDPSYGASDSLRFAAGVNAADVHAQRKGNDLVLTIADTGDSVTVRNQFLLTRYGGYPSYTSYYDFKIGSIQFADGTTWAGSSIPFYYAATGSLTAYGSGNADVFGGSSSSSTFWGYSGSDTYEVGPRAGLVTIVDYGSSTDTDTLSLASGIWASDVKLRRVNADLVLRFQDSPDQVTVTDYFSSNGIDRIAFRSDGTVWDRAAIAQQFQLATEQDDQLLGTAGDDVLDGGAGNDTLMGDAGNDSYLFGQGSGRDTIAGEVSGSGTLDAVVMKTGVAPADVALSRDGEDLLLSINTASDGLRISDYFHDYGDGTVVGNVEQIRFSDGTVWDSTLIRSKVPQPTNAADTVYGYETNDSLNGLGGNDTLCGGRGDDTLDGGVGNDLLQGGAGNNTYLFGAGSTSDTIDVEDNRSTPMENTVRLGAGFTAQQLATYRVGSDLLLFMPGGTDELTIQRQFFYDGGSHYYGIDQIIFDDGTVWDQSTIFSRAVAGLQRGTQGADSMVGTTSADLLYGYGGNDTLDGGVGNDTLTGGAGDDSYLVDSASDSVVENTNEGADTVLSSVTYTLPTNVENLTLTGFSVVDGTGNALDNALTGNYLANTLTGLAGNDTLDGAAGVDTLIGGTGNDTYVVDSTTEVVTENANEGIDTVRSVVTYTLGANVENLTLIGLEVINGSGNTLANTLVGNVANNMLDGGTGADTLQGGAGNDTYVVENAGDVIVEVAGEGADTVQSSIGYALAANVENLTLTGTAAINAAGNSLNNVLAGNSANNVLTGGLGNDTYVITSGDTIVENTGEGIDTVSADFAYTLGANLENLTLTGTGKINGTGNTSNNALTGNAGTNLLTGGAGNDTLDGGAGKDTMIGGIGDDYYVADLSTDVITENANEGVDTVQTTFTYTLGANLENLVLAAGAAINGTGNAFNNVITGNALSNILDGGVGADTLIGGAGDDTYVLDNSADVVTEGANEGTDTVQVALTYALSANVENLTLTGTSAVNATGNVLNNILAGNSAINVLTGGAGDDTYVVTSGDSVVENANEGTDTVQSGVTCTLSANLENLTLTGTTAINGIGNALDNVLTGNSAANVLTGGAGNDTYVIGTGDTVVENASEGIDAVQSSVTATLSSYVENLTLTGASAINGTGNALDNVLTGNSAANVLTGGAGNDAYVVGAGDSVIESLNAGIDSVLSSATFTLGVNVENLTLTGSSSTNATGNALNNVLIGNGANNFLDGGAGQDYLAGGTGDDTYVVDDAGDVVVENAGEGTDTVQTTASYVAGGNIENVTLLGSSAINATGDAGNNALTGNSAANSLSGGAGNDTLSGNGGADTLSGGTGDDSYIISAPGSVVIENVDEGVDVVQAAVTYALGDNIENLTLTGIASINGTGNALSNTLTGNAGNNTLDGAGGADTVYGGDGDDTLIGTAASRLIGGAGNDTYIFTGAIDLWGSGDADPSGIDTIQSDASISMYRYSYWSNQDSSIHYVGEIENATLIGTANGIIDYDNDLDNILTGNSGNNRIIARWGNDTLNGGDGNDYLYGGYGINSLVGGAGNDTLDNDGGYSGADTLLGGSGDDLYMIGNSLAVVVENANEGIDTVQLSYLSAYTLGANVENILSQGGTHSMTGNGLNNVITGGGGSGYGADTLSGLAGDDTLDGGQNADTMIGGTGNDVYFVDNIGDVVTENIGEGTDTVQAAIAYTLGSNVENLTLTGSAAINGVGNTLNNVLAGNSGNNVLTGGAGNDTYAVTSGDTVVENANEGTDTVQASFSYVLGANLENLTLTGTAAVNGTGNAVANALTGNAGNNVLDGGAGADTMTGGLGNDTYVVDSASDIVIENLSEGTDTVQSSVTYSLAANVENLTLTGSLVINGLGNALANVLAGNAAANVLTGGLGDDTYVINDTLDSVVENANEGIDTVQSSITYTLGANLENLVLTGSAAINGYGNALANTLTGSGSGGANVLAGGLGDDTYILNDYADAIVENANEGTDIVNSAIDYSLSANVENLVLTGFAYTGAGNSLANAITGNTYGNVLDGALGADTMIGGRGDDTYLVDNVGDVVNESAGEGLDTVQSSVTFTIATNVENLALTGTAAINAFGNAANNTLTGNSAINTLAGGAGDDIYVIGAGDIVSESANEGIDTVQVDLTYTLGANVENLTLTGYAAINAMGNSVDNVLTGNSAANVLTGGAGNDTYVLSTGDTVVELANQGIDTVRSDVTYALGANVENLTLIDWVGPINGTGNGLDNVLTGNNYANVLTGGAGNDTYVVSAGDAVVEAINEGTDTVLASVSYALTDNVENVTLTGTATIDATGNGLDNFLTGNAANNTLDGQIGADHMNGGAGNDTYWVDSTGDVVTESANEGIDTVQSFVDYTLGANLENLSLNSVQVSTGTGNELNNVITGTTADNLLIGLGGDDNLDGRMGADTMVGGVGNDIYAIDNIDDVIVENLNEGIDTVQSKIDYVLGANLENLTLLGIAAVYGTGNGANNALIGAAGDNVLDGGAGADTMTGGRGNDVYFVDNVGDSVTENANEGSDTILSSVSFTLVANVENLTLTGSDAINGVGNASDNILIGNSASNALSATGGNNYFDGGAGADSLSGGSGNDIYVVDDLGDIVQDASSYDADTVRSSVSFALSNNLENLTLTGTNAVDGAGNANANILSGNASANVLDGGASADRMLAGAGDDTYIVDNIGDWVGEYADEGIDTVRSSVTFALGVNVENLELTGNAAIDGADNVLGNTLLGNAANNKLSAGGGNDTLVGAGGADTLSDSDGDNVLIGGVANDTLLGGTGADVFAFNRGDGTDTLVSAGGGIDTLSIGGGIGYADMTFGKAGNDLLFGLGAGEQIVLKDWYANAGQRTVAGLQVIAQAMSDFSQGGSDPLRDNNVEQFDFAGLVGRFDQALAANPSITSWALSDALGEFHTSGSDTTAIGGDVVLQYGINGQTPAVGNASTLMPAALASASEGSSLPAASSSDSMASSVDMLFGSSVDTTLSEAADSTGGAAGWLLTEHRLDPSFSKPSDDVAGVAGIVGDGATLPSVDLAIHGSANVPTGGITRGSSAMGASSSSGHGAGAVQGAPGGDAASGASGAATANGWGHSDVSLSESRTTSPSDALNKRIDRALDEWLQARDTSPSIRLSHYDEVLRGESAASRDARGDAGSDVSYSSRWQRLRFLLDQHVSTFGDVAALDLGSQPWSQDAMSGALGDGTNAQSKFGARTASARTPLPMFSGLQDGFDRL